MRLALVLLLLASPAHAFELPFDCGEWSQCRPVQVHEKSGRWYHHGRLISYTQVVPIRSPDGRAYLCGAPKRCFIRPFM